MSDNTQNPKSLCKSCGEQKEKIFLKYHRSPGNGNSLKKRKKYVDSKGLQWHGSKCPDCASKWRNDKYSKDAQDLKAELQRKLGTSV